MYAAKRPPLRPVLLILIITSFILAACGQAADTNWPGLSANGETIYVAHGPGVTAYDAATQQQAWSYPVEANRALQFYAAPSVDENRVIIGDYGEMGGFFSPNVIVTIYGLQVNQNGVETIWTRNDLAGDRIVAPPLQVDDRAFVGTADNRLLALDARNGQLLWQFEMGHSVWGQPAYKDGKVFVASLDKAIYALEAESGAELWRQELGGALASHPVVDEDLVYVVSFDGALHALDVETGVERWAAEAQDWIWSAPALADDEVYFIDRLGNLFAVDARTGNQIWTRQVLGAVQTSPVVVNDVVYVASEGNRETGQGLLTALSATDGQQLWQVNTPAPLYTTPVVVGDSIVVVVQSPTALLIAYHLETGAQQWLIPPPAR